MNSFLNSFLNTYMDVFQRKHLEMKLLGHRVCASSTLLDIVKLVSKEVISIYTPAGSA